MKVVQMNKLIDASCKSNTVAEEHVSSENMHFGIVCCRWSSRYTLNSSQQTVKYIEFIQEVVLPKVSDLNASAMKNKKKTISFQEKERRLFIKIKMDLRNSEIKFITIFVVVTSIITSVDRPCYKIIDSSLQKETSLSYSKY